MEKTDRGWEPSIYPLTALQAPMPSVRAFWAPPAPAIMQARPVPTPTPNRSPNPNANRNPNPNPNPKPSPNPNPGYHTGSAAVVGGAWAVVGAPPLAPPRALCAAAPRGTPRTYPPPTHPISKSPFPGYHPPPGGGQRAPVHSTARRVRSRLCTAPNPSP